MKKPSKILHRNSDTYMELDDQTCFEVTENKRVRPRVLTDAMIDDEEKVISATTEDAMSHESRHVAPRTRVGVCG